MPADITAETRKLHNRRLVEYLDGFRRQLEEMLTVHPANTYWLANPERQELSRIYKDCLPWHKETLCWLRDYEAWRRRYLIELSRGESDIALPEDIVKSNAGLQQRLREMCRTREFQINDQCFLGHVSEYKVK